MCYLEINSLIQCNRAIKASANVVTKLLNITKGNKREKKEPWWRKRLNNQIKDMRKEI